MSTAALREARDHDTSLPGAAAVAAAVILAALAAQFSPPRAAAQSAPCTAIQDDAERLACYDRALRAAPAAPSPQSPAAQAPAAQSTAPQSSSAAVTAPSASAPAASSAGATSPASAATATAAPTQEANKIVPIVVVSVRVVPGRAAVFTTRDGATWVQNDGQTITGLPDTPFDADLKPGAMGSQFLVPKDFGRA